MTPVSFTPRTLRTLIAAIATATMLAATAPLPVEAHAIRDETSRTAVVLDFAPELALLRKAMEGASVQMLNGASFTTGRLEGREVVLFLGGISVVNAAMTVQLACIVLDRASRM